jgi:hypothetical protein
VAHFVEHFLYVTVEGFGTEMISPLAQPKRTTSAERICCVADLAIERLMNSAAIYGAYLHLVWHPTDFPPIRSCAGTHDVAAQAHYPRAKSRNRGITQAISKKFDRPLTGYSR